MGEGNVFDKLTALRQTWTMEEYISRFECLIAQVPHKEQYCSYFTYRLRDDIKAQIRSLHVANPI